MSLASQRAHLVLRGREAGFAVKPKRPGKGGGAEDGMAVTQRSRLLHKMQTAGVGAGGRAVGGLVARTDHNADLLDARLEHLFEDDGEGGFLGAVAVHEGLQGQGALVFAGGSDESFVYLHGTVFV